MSLCLDISQGLQELHQIAWLHKHLHDYNILIKDDRAKIGDFYYPLLGFSQDSVGPCVPPEGFKSSQSHIYSLGVLFIQIVTSITEKHVLLQIVNAVMKETAFKDYIYPLLCKITFFCRQFSFALKETQEVDHQLQAFVNTSKFKRQT